MSMAMVQLMLPGLAFFYAGLLHRRSVVTMIMQNFAAMGLIFVLWFLFVFSLCFGESWVFFGSILTYPCFLNVDGEPLSFVDDIPGLVFAAYQGARYPRMPHILFYFPQRRPSQRP
jgi:Amt family ammonium transporter